MRTSELLEKVAAELGTLTLDDYYADNKLGIARNVFRNLTRCTSDEEITTYLHAQKPFISAASALPALNDKLKLLENKQQAELANVTKVKEALAKLKMEENAACIAISADGYSKQTTLMARRTVLMTDLTALKAQGGRPPVKKIAALEAEVASIAQELEELRENSNRQYAVYLNLKKEVKECNAKFKAIKDMPYVFSNEIRNVKDYYSKLSYQNEAYFKKDADALDALFAILLNLRLESKDNLTTELTPTLNLSPAERMAYVKRYAKSRGSLPKDWRQQLHRICSFPLKRLSGTISFPTEEGAGYFEDKKHSLAAADMAAFLALKIASLHHEYVLTGTGTIVLALPGGLAALVNFREKGKVVAKRQTANIETYINCLQVGSQYTYHSLYHYDGGPAAGVGIMTPGAYYILSEAYVIEISFAAAPMLLGFDIMAKTSQNISIVARLDEEKAREEAPLWQPGEWEED